MRTLIAFLLLANVVFFYWTQYFDRPHQREPLPAVGELKLAERAVETDPSPAPGVPAGAAEPAAPETPAIQTRATGQTEPAVTDREPRIPQQPDLASGGQATDGGRADLAEDPVVVAPAPAPGSPTVEPSEAGPDSTPGSVTPTLPEGVVSASEVSGAAPDVPTQVTEPSPSISRPASREVDTEALDVPLADPAVDLAAGVAESALSTESRPTPEGYAEAEPVPPTRPSTADSPDVVSVPDESVAGVSQEADAVEICLRLGPMDDPDAAVLLGNLPQDASIVIDAVEEYTRDGGFFVMIPPLPTRGEAEDMLRRLAAAGIDDTWLFRTGNSVNGISLGLFTREATAQRHADDLTLRGFASEVRRRQVSATGRFITLRLPADAPAPDDLGGVGQGIPVSCP